MNKYEERVKQRASELTKESQGVLFRRPKTALAIARLSVQREAEAFKEAYMIGMDPLDLSLVTMIEENQRHRGLIPPQTQTK